MILLQRGEPLSGVTFPYAYTLGGDGIGYTEEGKWRLFFWLSNNPDSHLDKAPSSGDPYGFVDYDALDCGMSGFCGVKEGVNIAINQTAP